MQWDDQIAKLLSPLIHAGGPFRNRCTCIATFNLYIVRGYPFSHSSVFVSFVF